MNFSKYNVSSPDSPLPEPNTRKKYLKNNSVLIDEYKGHSKDNTSVNSVFYTDSNDALTAKSLIDRSFNNRRQSFEGSQNISSINNSNYSIGPLRIKTKFGSNSHLSQSPSTNFYALPLNSVFSPITPGNLTSHKSNQSLNSVVYNTLIYGEPEHEHDIEGFVSPAKSEHIYTFSPKVDNFDNTSFISKVSKVTYTSQSICTPTNISLTDNCPYYYSDELQGLDEIIDFIEKKFLRIDGEMRAFILSFKTLKEKQVINTIIIN